MASILNVRLKHGYQAIPDIKRAVINPQFRGLPILNGDKCSQDCNLCETLCPARAIHVRPLKLDLGKCIFCGDCEKFCPNGCITFTPFHKLSTTLRDSLVIQDGMDEEQFHNSAIQIRDEIRSIFGRSLKLRQVCAAGCNGCEMELNACSNVNFDMGRFGIEFVASPRHADGIVITGPISENMASALLDTYNAVPDPKIVIAAGACAISGGIFADSPALRRDFFNSCPIDLFIPGCPVHPLTVINGILDFCGR